MLGKVAQAGWHKGSPEPHWNETLAAQRMITDLIAENRMDVFLDLHNPAPSDPTFFYILPDELINEPMIGLRDRFIDLAYATIVFGTGIAMRARVYLLAKPSVCLQFC